MSRFYQGRALCAPISHAVALVAGAFAFVALFVAYLWAVSLGLPN